MIRLKIEPKLEGHVLIKVNNRILYDSHNDITEEFAVSLLGTVVLGQLQSTGYAQSQYVAQFGIPDSIAILFLSSGAVVNSITTTLNGFNDQLTANSEVTNAVFIGSDSTPATYTFDTIQLWSVVANRLFMPISTFTLPTPFTKGEHDIIQITWSETITSYTPFVHTRGSFIYSCLPSCTSCNQGNFNPGFYCATSVFNLVWALLVVPNIQNLQNLNNYPISCYLNKYFQVYQQTGAPPQFLGIIEVEFFDGCLNSAGIYAFPQGFVSAQLAIGSQHVYATYNFNANITAQPQVALVLVSIQGIGLVPLAVINTQNVAVIPNSSNPFNITLKIPYGAITLQQSSVP